MMTAVPAGPLVGEKEVMRGRALFTVKLVELVTLPAVLVTLVGPPSTVAWIKLPETMIKAVGGSSLILTLVAPEKPVPLIVTTVPIGPVVGEKDLITGCTTKLAELAAVPKVFVTAMGPLVAAGGTTTVICVSEFTVKAPRAPF